MISITCTNCTTNLTIDDAFAGGVCRCKHCGTIQTVPSKSNTAASPQPAPANTSLYQKQARQTGTVETGLEDLADAVASSSGLSGSGLRSRRNTRVATIAPKTAQQAVEVSPEEQPNPRRSWMPVILIASAAAIVLVGIVLAVVLARGPKSGASGPADSAVSGPSFCGVPIQADSVIFLLDRGASLSDLFDTLKATCYKSIADLGPDRKFQVILWDNDLGPAEFPPATMRSATAGAVADCRRDFEDVVATGSSHLSGPMREAMERHPGLIVVATGKLELNEDDAAALRAAVGKGVRIDSIQINSPTSSAVLKEVCSATGGQFRMVSASELRSFAQ